MTVETASAPAEAAPSTESAAPPESRSPQDGSTSGEQPTQSSQSRPRPSPEALYGANTRLSQSNAALKRALGLEPSTPDEKVLARISELQQGPEESSDAYDPVLDRERAALIEREWATAERIAGPEKVALARQVQDLAITSASPLDLVDAIEELVKQYASSQEQAAPPPQQGQTPPTPAQAQQARAADVAPEGDAPVGFHLKPEQDEVGTGDVQSAAAKAFAAFTRLRR